MKKNTATSHRARRFRPIIISASVVCVLFIVIFIEYSCKGSPDDVATGIKGIIAHRGVHQNYNPQGDIDRLNGCEASRIYPPAHGYIENTVESISAAIAMGATLVEVDIRRTADSDLVIMHDWALECRTNGSGKISERTVGYLKSLDIGYGYTPDGGKTFPLRGKGIGKMMTFSELLAEFPDTAFLIDHKDFDEESTGILISLLAKYSAERRALIFHWGDEKLFAKIKMSYPEMRQLFISREAVMKALVPFVLSFGIISIPPEFRGLIIPIPVKYVKFLWGWPYRFIEAMHKNGMKVYLYIDTKEDAIAYESLPLDGFVTDYIEITGPVFVESLH